MKLKFKRFIKRFLIVTVISVFLFCFLTISSSAYTVSGAEYNSFEYSDLIFNGIPQLSYWPTDDPSVVTYLSDTDLASIRYRIPDNKLTLDLIYNDSIFTYGNTYEIILRFLPSGDLQIPKEVFYGSYSIHFPAEGNNFFPIPDSVSSYRTGVDSSTNTAVVDYAIVNNIYPTFTSTFDVSNSGKVIYNYYYLKFRFTFGYSSTPPRNSIFLYLLDVDFQSMSFTQFDNLYSWNSPVSPPLSGPVDEMKSLEDLILGATSEGRQNTIDLFSNFSLVPWLRKGFLATTHIFNLFADIPALNEILKFSLIFGSFAFVVGMSISLVKKR
jgi:hypothetical protein